MWTTQWAISVTLWKSERAVKLSSTSTSRSHGATNGLECEFRWPRWRDTSTTLTSLRCDAKHIVWFSLFRDSQQSDAYSPSSFHFHFEMMMKTALWKQLDPVPTLQRSARIFKGKSSRLATLSEVVCMFFVDWRFTSICCSTDKLQLDESFYSPIIHSGPHHFCFLRSLVPTLCCGTLRSVFFSFGSTQPVALFHIDDEKLHAK